MEKQYCYKYPRPALTTDCVVFGFDGADLSVLLIRRANEPFQYAWAFPGGFLEMNETVEEGVLRELREETGIIPGFYRTGKSLFGSRQRSAGTYYYRGFLYFGKNAGLCT